MAASTRSKKTGKTLPFSSKMADICLQIKCREQRDYPPCFMWMLVFMLKEDRCKCEWKPPTNYARKYICLVSFLHIHTKYLDLQLTSMQEASTWWEIKAFDDYMCTSVNVKKCISYIVNENYKIGYTVQYIKVQDLYMCTMLCTFYVYTG